MSRKMTAIFLTLLLIFSLGLSACETMHGAGEDIEHAGEGIQQEAE